MSNSNPLLLNVPDSDWNSWIWQQQHRVRSLSQLAAVVNLTSEERTAFVRCDEKFRVAITPYYASLMDPNDPLCPIRLQAVPKLGELIVSSGEQSDPLAEETHMPVPGITHRYPDRVLFYTSHHCPVYCRHCTRKRKVSDPESAVSLIQLEEGFRYIAEHPEVRDVLISGGDPLSNSDERLEWILSRLRSIPHVEILRIGTRNLVTLPQRITPALADVLRKYPPLFIQTHFNHPKECTPEAAEACRLLAEAGCVLNNQMVLLKGINDNAETVRTLNHRLLQMRVQPYYMLACDLVEGIGHFRVSIEKSLEILRALRGWTSGLAVPAFVVDLPGGGGKVQLVPESVIRREGSTWEFRNYQGRSFTYIEQPECEKVSP